MKKVAIYCRVSTSEQTVENQKRDLQRYCEARKWEIVQTFEDVGVSGAQHDRPALAELMAQAAKRKFNAVLVWKFDRFARSTNHLLEALQVFKELGIEFVSLSEGIDTSTAAGKMLFTIVGSFAEFERSLIQERVVAGIRRAQAEGTHCGRPRKGFDVGKALELHKAGHSLRSIAKTVGASYATVYRTLVGVQGVSKGMATA